jgi:hypothetical protein
MRLDIQTEKNLLFAVLEGKYHYDYIYLNRKYPYTGKNQLSHRRENVIIPVHTLTDFLVHRKCRTIIRYGTGGTANEKMSMISPSSHMKAKPLCIFKIVYS